MSAATLVAACRSAACAPPPAGTGGSSPSGGARGALSRVAAKVRGGGSVAPSRPVGMDGKNISAALAGRLTRPSAPGLFRQKEQVTEELAPIATTTLPSGHTTRLKSVAVNHKFGQIIWSSTVHDPGGKQVGSYTASVGSNGVTMRTSDWASEGVKRMDLQGAIKSHIGHTPDRTKPEPRQQPDLSGWSSPPAVAASSATYAVAMSNVGTLAVIAACYDKSCAPPPAGRGGSSPRGGGVGGVLSRAMSRIRGGSGSEAAPQRSGLLSGRIPSGTTEASARKELSRTMDVSLPDGHRSSVSSVKVRKASVHWVSKVADSDGREVGTWSGSADKFGVRVTKTTGAAKGMEETIKGRVGHTDIVDAKTTSGWAMGPALAAALAAARHPVA